jgi:integrase
MRLTETIVRNLPTPTKDTLDGDDATTGLYLRRYASGRRTWLYRTRKGGSWRTENLGEWPGINLAQARAKATALSTITLPDAVTFGTLLSEWYDRRIEPNYRVTNTILTYVERGKAWLGNVKLTQLDTPALVQKLQAYADVAPVAANRCLSNWRLALDYAVECGYIQTNPLARTTTRVVGGTEQSRERTLTDAEIVALWRSGETLLRFLLLTGLRISEAQTGYRDGSRWRCDRTKNGKPHWVHLPVLAIEQIEPWTTSATAAQSKLRRWCERTGTEPFTPHDLRRTFATRLAGIGIAPHVVEKCLNHSMQGVMATYNRHEYEPERVEATEQWSARVQEIVTHG